MRGADLPVHDLNALAFEADHPGGLAGPRFAAALARQAGVRTLVITHHGPWMDGEDRPQRLLDEIRAESGGELLRGEDLMAFTL